MVIKITGSNSFKDDDILVDELLKYSRLRTNRRRKRAQYKDFDKKLLRLHREEKTINTQIRNLGWEELKPPIQNGWKRSFILRDDVRRSQQSLFFQRILDKINTTEYSWRKDFKKKVRRYGKKVYVTREQNLRELPANEFFSGKFIDTERLYFYEVIKHPQWSKKPEVFYVFCESWRFTLKVQPRMITHIRIHDTSLKSKSQEISSYLARNNLYPRLLKILHGYDPWGWKAQKTEKYINPIKNTPLHTILNEHWIESKWNDNQHNPRITPRVFSYNLFFRWLHFLRCW